MPPPPHGWQRARRRMPSHEPRRAPWRSNASSAYAEHDGWKRHRGVKCTLTSRQARIGSIRSRAASDGTSGRVSTTAFTIVPRPPRTAPRACRRARRMASSRLPGGPRPNTRRRAGESAPPVPRQRGGDAGPGCAPPRWAPRTRRTRPAGERRRRRPPSAPRSAPVRVAWPRRGPRTSHDRGRAGSGGEACAAAMASGLEYGPPAPGTHAGPEAVTLLALPVVRLKRALHAWPPREGFAREPVVGGRNGRANHRVYGEA